MILDHSYANELNELVTHLTPQSLKNARVVAINQSLRSQLNLPWETQDAWLEALFSVNSPLTQHSVAQKYGGHQFGHWNPDLGDGRGLLLSEVVTPEGKRFDLHLKGSGPTPYSRFADGRAVLRSTIREYLASEALFHLGIPSSRALCLLTSDEMVYREKSEKAAMLIRVSQSHLRFGHFEYYFHSQQLEKLQSLFDYSFKYHFSEYADQANPHALMLSKIVHDTATMIAKWQAYGFNHGVMNTDNMSIHGITFDFGPYAFLDDFDPRFICNHSDPQGRYSFDNQPGIGLWNLNALAMAFTPYLSRQEITNILQEYEQQLLKEYAKIMRAKCGLIEFGAHNSTIINEWLDMLASEKKDYSQYFRLLCDFDPTLKDTSLRDSFIDRPRFERWAEGLSQSIAEQDWTNEQRSASMKKHNPNYILRNYLAQQVIDRAEEGDFSLFDAYLTALSCPFNEHPEYAKFAAPPPDWGKKIEISCSS
ncbi:protein adenylyltransferase SelO [Flavobacterium sp. W21_SRS_FM6]|uniref:protein adenylyltransferase SelO n=1 Tax=Flavobacterium sp. W21_SRS_FM6 TaxID=3240268 RepID=UPI003F93952D